MQCMKIKSLMTKRFINLRQRSEMYSDVIIRTEILRFMSLWYVLLSLFL